MQAKDNAGEPAQASQGRSVLGTRHPNFRTLAGQTPDGRRLREAAFLRGPALHDLTEADWLDLPGVTLGLIVDLRHPNEIAERPNRVPEALSARMLNLPVHSEAARPIFAAEAEPPVNHEIAQAAMIAVYRDFVRSNAGAYAAFLAALADLQGQSVFFHCTAGKDRTGIAAALVLLALGMPRDLVMQDFLATAQLWVPDARLAGMVPPAAHAAVFGVQAAYLEAALEEFDALHGGPTAFARSAMGGENRYRAWIDRNLV